MTALRSNCKEVIVRTRRKSHRNKVRLYTCSWANAGKFECYECRERIEGDEVYGYTVVRIERKDPRTNRYTSHLEYRKTHDCCPEKRR